ncbi:Phosphoglucosamine mutase [Streptococcus pneumoniae]|nr:Phosphoglucosamine mutase [Streptococcus pneumoniae]
MTKVEVEMNGEGRILVRPSGTEPLVRATSSLYSFSISSANGPSTLAYVCKKALTPCS